MADRVGSLLRDAAEQLCATEHTPDVASVRARVHRRPAQVRRRAWVPALAALAVVGVVGAVQLIPQGGVEQQPVAIPPAPTLGKVVPPMEVRTRLGAPGGHVNGPAVADADLLAVAPARQGGLSLQTVGVVRPRPKPDAQGKPLVDRCVYTYSEPARTILAGSCQWAAPAAGYPEPELTLSLQGAPGETFLIGTAPAGTAAVRLRTDGREDLLVAVASAGAIWSERPRYVAWWPRLATSVAALDAEGRELARTRLPSAEPVRAAPDDPELGTVELDVETTAMFTRHFGPGTPPPLPATVEPMRVDVLARLPLGGEKTLYTVGYPQGPNRCVMQFLQDFSGESPAGRGGGGGCGPLGQPESPPIRVQRSSSAGTGEPGEELISGSAPAGTDRIILTASGVPEQSVQGYDSGPRWEHRAYFMADWPSAAPTTVRAVDRGGRTLAVWNDKGMNPSQFEPAYLEKFARCLEAAGIRVTRHPQPQGAGPAYEYGTGDLTEQEREALEAACEAQASRAD